MTTIDKLEALILAKLEDYRQARPLENATEDTKALGTIEGLQWVLDIISMIHAEQKEEATPNEFLGWVHEYVWRDATSRTLKQQKSKPLDPTPGLLSQRIVAAYAAPPATVPVDMIRNVVPTNWCDSLLTGPNGLGQAPWGCRDVERLLNGIRARIEACIAVQQRP